MACQAATASGAAPEVSPLATAPTGEERVSGEEDESAAETARMAAAIDAAFRKAVVDGVPRRSEAVEAAAARLSATRATASRRSEGLSMASDRDSDVSLGAFSVALSAVAYRGVSRILTQAWASPMLACTLAACGMVLTPFLFISLVMTGLGLLCCAPVALLALCGTLLPSALRQLTSGAVGLTQSGVVAHALSSAKAFAVERPVQSVALVGGVMTASPLVLLLLAVGAFWYIVLFPLTVPLTLYLGYTRLLPPLREVLTDPATGRLEWQWPKHCAYRPYAEVPSGDSEDESDDAYMHLDGLRPVRAAPRIRKEDQ